MTYLLDTSALLAHYFHEPCAPIVDRLICGLDDATGICVTSLLEMCVRLTAQGVVPAERARAIDVYQTTTQRVWPVSLEVVHAAIELKAAVRPRLPAMDALIAGCAMARGATLVHKDPHFDAIPPGLLKTFRLPDAAEPATSADVPGVVKEAGKPYKVGKRKTRV